MARMSLITIIYIYICYFFSEQEISLIIIYLESRTYLFFWAGTKKNVRNLFCLKRTFFIY